MLEREVRNLEDKIKSGIIHCANYVCNGCPYKYIYDAASEEMSSAAAGYVRCMQRLIEDIYIGVKEIEEV